jgi:hypothetical protein
VSIWINISEVFRYFVIVRPEMQSYLHMIPNIANMNLGIFTLWGIWDTVLSILVVFSFWLMAEKFGYNRKTALYSATFSWLWLFFMFWFASANMNLASWSFVIIPMFLSWIEMLVASFIVLKLFTIDKNIFSQKSV